MSAVKTLVAPPVRAMDEIRGRVGPFAVPAPRLTGLGAGGVCGEPGSAFQSVFAGVTKPREATASGWLTQKPGRSRKAAAEHGRPSASDSPGLHRDDKAEPEKALRDSQRSTGDERESAHDDSSGGQSASGHADSEGMAEVDGRQDGDANTVADVGANGDGRDGSARSETGGPGEANGNSSSAAVGEGAGQAADATGDAVSSTGGGASNSAGDSCRRADPRDCLQALARNAEGIKESVRAAGASTGAAGSATDAAKGRAFASADVSRGPDRTTEVRFATVPGTARSANGELAHLLALAAGLADQGSTSSRDGGAGTSGSQTGNQPGAGASPGTNQALPASAGGVPGNAAGLSRTEAFDQILGTVQAAPARESDVGEQIANLVRSNVGTKHSSVTIRLDPPELGQIQLQARLHGDVLSIRVQAETSAARDLLQANVEDLRQALDRHGIRIDRFDVEPRPASPASQGQGAENRPGGGQSEHTMDHGAGESWQQQGSPFWMPRSGRGDGDVQPGDADYGLKDDADGQTAGALSAAGRGATASASLVNLVA